MVRRVKELELKLDCEGDAVEQEDVGASRDDLFLSGARGRRRGGRHS